MVGHAATEVTIAVFGYSLVGCKVVVNIAQSRGFTLSLRKDGEGPV
jgi:hypothetical protein